MQMQFDKLKVIDNKEFKICESSDYNSVFDKNTGYFLRWGRTKDEDPLYGPSPELIDLEISVNGCPNNCDFCYKGNTNDEPTNMNFEDFKIIIDKLPKTVNQIAFGITGVQTNPHFIEMLEYCRKKGIIPNFTLSGIDLTNELAEKCSKLVGAVAVSVYQKNKNVCYDTVKKFTDLGLDQTNIHIVIFEENMKFVYEVLNDIKKDKRLKELNAIVFLGIKNKGRAKNKFKSIDVVEFQKLIEYCFENNIDFGMDSCSTPKFEYVVNKMNIDKKRKNLLLQYSESCESFGLFSAYINVFSKYFPCSFVENEIGWEEGISVLECEDFVRDIWFSEKVKKWRKRSLEECYKSGCRKCLIFDEINPKEI